MKRFWTKRRLIYSGLILILISFFFNPLGQINRPQLSEIQPRDDNRYHLRIEAFQWGYQIVDPFVLNELMAEGLEWRYAHRESVITRGSTVNLHFDVGLPLQIQFYSRDVLHGLIIDALDFKISADWPKPGDEFSNPSFGVIQLPDETTELRGYEFIDFGIGAADMEINFFIGDTYGIKIVWSILMIFAGTLILITAYYLENFFVIYRINSPIDLYPDYN